MNISRRGLSAFATASLVAAAFSVIPAASNAQEWPTKPVTIVVPYNPGASNDNFGRGLAQAMSEKLGQPVVVENRAGAGGFQGANYVSRADPDGYTLLFTSDAVTRLGRKPSVDFDVFTDMTPISSAVQAPLLLVVSSDLPVDNVQDFIAWANANDSKAFYASTGVGSTTALAAELFNSAAGTKLKNVPYPSAAPAVNDVAGGRVPAVFATQSAAAPLIDAGKLKLLGYSGPYAPTSAPQAPTIADEGVEGFDASIWYGVYGPAGMPDDLVAKINAAVAEASKNEAFLTLLDNSGGSAAPRSVADFRAFLEREISQVDKLVESGAVTFQ